MIVMKIISQILSFVFPITFSCCGTDLDASYGGRICASCMNAFPKIVSDDAAYSVFLYKDKARRLILKFKYGGKMFLAKDFGAQMANKFKELPFYDSIDCIVPVPLNIVRRIKRGYNQAELLSREISKLTQKPVAAKSLYRKKMTSPQFKLSKEERAKNVKGSFFVKNEEFIRDKTILLIDDIITTGATAAACMAALKQSGAKKVYVLSLARD